MNWLKRALLIVVAAVVVVLMATYAGDYAVLRYRMAAQKNPFGQVTVTPYFAVKLKDGKVEYDFQDPQNVTCANSLYPHMGLQPCWYLARHREQRIDIGANATPGIVACNTTVAGTSPLPRP